MKKLNSEWRFILQMVILVAIFLFVRHMFIVNTEHEVESAYEAGYASAMEDVINMSTIVETKEVDGDVHITVELPDGNIHEFISPKALG